MIRVRSPWDGDTPLAAKLWPANAWHGSPEGKAIVLYRELPPELLADGRFTVVRTTLERKAIIDQAKDRATPCMHRGEVIKTKVNCNVGPSYACALHGECTRVKCDQVAANCRDCKDYAAPWSMLLTGGIGDVFAVEAMLTESQRATLEAIYYACPASKTIAELFNVLPNYPKLKEHHILPTGDKVYYQLSDVRSLYQLPERIADWSILIRFYANHPYRNSSFVEHRLASPLLPTEPYVVLMPLSEWGQWPGRNFDPGDWDRVTAFLEAKNLRGVVLNVKPRPIPENKRLIDMQGKTTIAEAVELLKGAAGFLGIDSCLSVLAAKLFPANRMCVKNVANADFLKKWQHVYYAPHKSFDFIRSRMEAPSWE